jgi:predicted HAD superfamily Cof-like phosphohydrolase
VNKDIFRGTWMSPYLMVAEFHKKFGVPIGTEITEELSDLRTKLMYEELHEIEEELYPVEAIPTDRGMMDVEIPVNKVKLTKELADLMYVTIGTAVTFGLPLEQVFAEVHRSNMSKLGEDGKPIYREDGKVLKGPNYSEPNLERFFD